MVVNFILMFFILNFRDWRFMTSSLIVRVYPIWDLQSSMNYMKFSNACWAFIGQISEIWFSCGTKQILVKIGKLPIIKKIKKESMSFRGSLRIFLIWSCSWPIVLFYKERANSLMFLDPIALRYFSKVQTGFEFFIRFGSLRLFRALHYSNWCILDEIGCDYKNFEDIKHTAFLNFWAIVTKGKNLTSVQKEYLICLDFG